MYLYQVFSCSRKYQKLHYMKSVRIHNFSRIRIFRIQTKYGDKLHLFSKSPYVVLVRKNKDNKSSEHGHLSYSVSYIFFILVFGSR